jgi:large subunit ribosomal protein L21
MYAVIETGGKQYRVEVGTELEVELLDVEPGESLNVERVLLVADGDTAVIGRPLVGNASVAAEVVRRDRGVKTISFKYRPKARRRVKKGHRQELSILRISDIVLGGKSAAAEKAEADKARQAERAKLEEAAKKQAAVDAELAAKLAADKKAESKPKADEKAPARGRGRTTTAKADTKTDAKAKADAKPAAKSPAKPAAKASGIRATTKTDAKPARGSRGTKKDS